MKISAVLIFSFLVTLLTSSPDYAIAGSSKRTYELVLPAEMSFSVYQDGKMIVPQVAGQGFKFNDDESKLTVLKFVNGQIVELDRSSIRLDGIEHTPQRNKKIVLVNSDQKIRVKK